jgi:hypothetical protein
MNALLVAPKTRPLAILAALLSLGLIGRKSLIIDFAYMPVYAFTFAALTLLAARAASGRAQSWGLWLALAPFGAWAFDILENVGLLVALRRHANPPALELAVSAAAAILKFGLLGLTVFYWFGVTIQHLANRRPV